MSVNSMFCSEGISFLVNIRTTTTKITKKAPTEIKIGSIALTGSKDACFRRGGKEVGGGGHKRLATKAEYSG